MSSLSSLESVRRRLCRRGLPPHYVDRLLGELQDHRADILAEHRHHETDDDAAVALAARRLGDPEELADLVVSQYRSRSFSGRHPVLMFLLAPIPLAALIWVAFIAILALIAQAVLYTLGDSTAAHPLAAWVAYLAHYASLFVPPAIATTILCRLAARSGRGWPWLVAASALVALLALCYYSSLIMPVAPGTGRYTIGLGFSTQPFHFPQVLQMAVPLAIGAFFLCRLSQRRRLAPSA